MHARGSLHTRISLVITALLAVAMLATAAVWIRETRNAIHEEMEAANRVASQWLAVLVAESRRSPTGGEDRLMSALREVGRLRAHMLEVKTAAGAAEPLYRSPEPTYKAGRSAPDWFAAQVTPTLAVRHFDAGHLQLSLTPDPSRSVLDAWDDLSGLIGWGLAILLLAWMGSHVALDRALRPLREIGDAFARGADGLFDRRLPAVGAPELDHLAQSYNRLADRLDDSLADNTRLEASQRFNLALQARLEDERRAIARELHDELAQGITAVRAIAGAIQQRSADQPGIHGSAQAIVAMAGQMHDGVRAILQRLRPPNPVDGGVDEAVQQLCAQWRTLHPGIHLDCRTDAPAAAVDTAVQHTIQRLLQESLTNVVRHAGASRVDVSLHCDARAIELRIADNGCGLSRACTDSRPRYGLTGMHERTLELGGELCFEPAPSGGLSVRATLPLVPTMEITSS
ncbi:HAMP domain-containing protein [Azoarcus sp. L1K30]|uniref:histidine kinase n=1 Tax=Azoarcus sp. L1K30 TaxID=2820277 RepID=UPI001B82847D|nr:histidine kinase [Azoarcus sp. L1K30]MBR0568753.1 HAMP domain-containing protein [Azoarcus sp. L1K30]